MTGLLHNSAHKQTWNICFLLVPSECLLLWSICTCLDVAWALKGSCACYTQFGRVSFCWWIYFLSLWKIYCIIVVKGEVVELCIKYIFFLLLTFQIFGCWGHTRVVGLTWGPIWVMLSHHLWTVCLSHSGKLVRCLTFFSSNLCTYTQITPATTRIVTEWYCYYHQCCFGPGDFYGCAI